MSGRASSPAVHREVAVPAGDIALAGTLSVPARIQGIVLFAHGSGSSRHSSRNRYVADSLERGGLATLLFDLLTGAEARDRANVFDISLLAERLLIATRWVIGEFETTPIGYFGASTGAAAALVAAAHGVEPLHAIVSRGGRPDLAGDALPRVTAPTLLIVGGADHPVLELNTSARTRLGGLCELAVVPNATHLFEERGALEEVARLAADWFGQYLRGERPNAPS